MIASRAPDHEGHVPDKAAPWRCSNCGQWITGAVDVVYPAQHTTYCQSAQLELVRLNAKSHPELPGQAWATAPTDPRVASAQAEAIAAKLYGERLRVIIKTAYSTYSAFGKAAGISVRHLRRFTSGEPGLRRDDREEPFARALGISPEEFRLWISRGLMPRRYAEEVAHGVKRVSVQRKDGSDA
jgi:hypothetical protein